MGSCISAVAPESRSIDSRQAPLIPNGSGNNEEVVTTEPAMAISRDASSFAGNCVSNNTCSFDGHIKASTGLLYKDYSSVSDDDNDCSVVSLLFGAIKRGDIAAVHSSLAASSRAAFATGMWGSTTLIAAAQYNKFDIANTLLDHILSYKNNNNMNNNSNNNDNDSNSNKDTEALKLEIDTIRHVNEKRASVVLFTCMWGDTSTLHRLLSLDLFAQGHTHGFSSEGPYITAADIEAHTFPLHNPVTDCTESISPLSVSICNNHPAVLDALLNHLSLFNSSSYVNHKFSFPIKVGITSKAHSHMYGNKGTSLLQLAIRCGNICIVDNLFDRGGEGLDLLSIDDDGCGIFHYIAKYPHSSTSDIILALKAFNEKKIFGDIPLLVNACDALGNSPLLLACESCNECAAEMLLGHGASANYANPENMHTPLHIAVTRRNVTLVNLLLDHSADPFAADSKGASPLSIALKMNKSSEIYLKIVDFCNKIETPEGPPDSHLDFTQSDEPFDVFDAPRKKTVLATPNPDPVPTGIDVVTLDDEELKKESCVLAPEYTHSSLASVDIEPIAPLSPSQVLPDLRTFPLRLSRISIKDKREI